MLADASSSQNDNFQFSLYQMPAKCRHFLFYLIKTFFMEEISDPNVKLAVAAAARSLGRCEQCRFSLEQKLCKKGFEADVIKAALDFLESKKYLDDERYAAFWIRNCCAFKPRGSLRLVRELCSRGVSRQIAIEAVKSYFETVDENEMCAEALKGLRQKNKSEKKIIKSLADSGFSYKIIQRVLKIKEGFDCGSE